MTVIQPSNVGGNLTGRESGNKYQITNKKFQPNYTSNNPQLSKDKQFESIFNSKKEEIKTKFSEVEELKQEFVNTFLDENKLEPNINLLEKMASDLGGEVISRKVCLSDECKKKLKDLNELFKNNNVFNHESKVKEFISSLQDENNNYGPAIAALVDLIEEVKQKDLNYELLIKEAKQEEKLNDQLTKKISELGNASHEKISPNLKILNETLNLISLISYSKKNKVVLSEVNKKRIDENKFALGTLNLTKQENNEDEKIINDELLNDIKMFYKQVETNESKVSLFERWDRSIEDALTISGDVSIVNADNKVALLKAQLPEDSTVKFDTFINKSNPESFEAKFLELIDPSSKSPLNKSINTNLNEIIDVFKNLDRVPTPEQQETLDRLLDDLKKELQNSLDKMIEEKNKGSVPEISGNNTPTLDEISSKQIATTIAYIEKALEFKESELKKETNNTGNYYSLSETEYSFINKEISRLNGLDENKNEEKIQTYQDILEISNILHDKENLKYPSEVEKTQCDNALDRLKTFDKRLYLKVKPQYDAVLNYRANKAPLRVGKQVTRVVKNLFFPEPQATEKTDLNKAVIQIKTTSKESFVELVENQLTKIEEFNTIYAQSEQSQEYSLDDLDLIPDKDHLNKLSLIFNNIKNAIAKLDSIKTTDPKLITNITEVEKLLQGFDNPSDDSENVLNTFIEKTKTLYLEPIKSTDAYKSKKLIADIKEVNSKLDNLPLKEETKEGVTEGEESGDEISNIQYSLNTMFNLSNKGKDDGSVLSKLQQFDNQLFEFDNLFKNLKSKIPEDNPIIGELNDLRDRLIEQFKPVVQQFNDEIKVKKTKEDFKAYLESRNTEMDPNLRKNLLDILSGDISGVREILEDKSLVGSVLIPKAGSFVSFDEGFDYNKNEDFDYNKQKSLKDSRLDLSKEEIDNLDEKNFPNLINSLNNFLTENNIENKNITDVLKYVTSIRISSEAETLSQTIKETGENEAKVKIINPDIDESLPEDDKNILINLMSKADELFKKKKRI